VLIKATFAMSSTIRNLAILVGINGYKNKILPLKTPVNDAIALAKVLERSYNYDVRTLLDTQATLEGQICLLSIGSFKYMLQMAR
jgi:hypothetical protein